MKNFLSILFSILFGISILFAQHSKKDGTPDMRYKENKATYSSSTYTPYKTGSHLTKDGTPDKRYKENNPKYNYTVLRDKNGKIVRSQTAINEFKKQTGYSKGRPGYVIDHIIPLKDGGCDCPENMQWQTIEDAKAKDKWE